jgi:hypothetical protein
VLHFTFAVGADTNRTSVSGVQHVIGQERLGSPADRSDYRANLIEHFNFYNRLLQHSQTRSCDALKTGSFMAFC